MKRLSLSDQEWCRLAIFNMYFSHASGQAMAIFWLYPLISAAAAQVVHQWTRQHGGDGSDSATSLQVDGRVEQSFELTGKFGAHLPSEL